MANTIRIRARMDGDMAQVKALMRHPMETGQRKDSDGNIIPAHYITGIKATSDGKTVMQGHWGPAISQNPFLSFRFKASAGDKVRLEWVDNQGERGSGEATIS